MSEKFNERDQYLLIIIEDLPVPAGAITAKKVQTGFHGKPEEMIEALALVMVHSAKYRELINAAGRMANKIRRGEMPEPGNYKTENSN